MKTFRMMIAHLARILIGSLIYVVTLIIPGMIFPLKEELVMNIPVEEMWFQLPSVLIAGLVYSTLILFFSRKSRLHSWQRILFLIILFYGSQTCLPQIESLYFLTAFPLLDTVTIGQFFITNLISALMYIPFMVFISGTGISNTVEREDFSALPPIIPVLVLAPLYMFLYSFFGQYIAYASESLRNLYAGWQSDVKLTQWLWLFQIFRGLLWTGLSWIGVNQFRKKRDAIIGMTAFYGLVLSIQMIHPNALMSGEIRVFHGIELFLSMTIYGLLSALVLTQSIPRLPFMRKKAA